MIQLNRKENLAIVQEQIERAAKRSGRNPEDVKLLAVSKVFPVEDVKEVYDLGIHIFGESRAQELRDKVPALPSQIAICLLNWV